MRKYGYSYVLTGRKWVNIFVVVLSMVRNGEVNTRYVLKFSSIRSEIPMFLYY